MGNSAANPFKPWLAQLRRGRGTTPKQLADFQIYMQQVEVEKKINKIFAGWHPDRIGMRGTIDLCVTIARELLAAESEERKREIHQMVEDAHSEALEKYENTGEVNFMDLGDEEEEAHKQLSRTFQPLLRGLNEFTGYHVTMIMGRIDGCKFDIKSLHEGTTKGDNPKDWLDWARPAYREHVMQQFSRFLLAADAEPGEDAKYATGLHPAEVLCQRAGVDGSASGVPSDSVMGGGTAVAVASKRLVDRNMGRSSGYGVHG
ncbi:hypothetical protein C8R43DRAFT_1143615 [Mycena crocata]|nr:hypothetical protein C8R43DRAFT_1143615 [Mycena crocata]